VDAGSVFGLKHPITEDIPDANDPRLQRPQLDASGNKQCVTRDTSGNITSTVVQPAAGCAVGSSLYTFQVASPFKEIYYGNSWKPRVSVGFGVSWNSPFGPLRIDIAKALVKQKGDDTKLFSFNVGTQF
jgi:outer membrane protein insertion porin family